MPLNDILQVRILCVEGAQIAFNVQHAQITTVTPPEPTYQEIATFVNGLLAAPYKSVMTSASQYRGIGVQRLFPLPLSLESVEVGSAGNGSVVGDAMPPQVAGLISLRTDFGGRAFRGRLYVPFPGEADNAATGVPTAGYLTGINAIGLFFPTAHVVPGGGGGNLTIRFGVYHRALHTITPIMERRLSPNWATQRRRSTLGRPNAPPF